MIFDSIFNRLYKRHPIEKVNTLRLSSKDASNELVKHGEDMANAKKYDEAFANSNIKLIKPAEGFSHAYHLYVTQVENRKGLYDYLKQHNIFAQVHYIPVPMFPYYKQLGYKTECYTNAKAYYDKCLSIPMYPILTDEEQDFVISKILEFIK